MDNQTRMAMQNLDRRLRQVYGNAATTAARNHQRALQRLTAFDARDLSLVDFGGISRNYHALTSGRVNAAAEAMRQNYLLQVERTKAIADNIARDLSKSGQIAARMIRGEQLNIFQNNYNWAVRDIQQQFPHNINFSVYNRHQLAALFQDGDPFRKVGVREYYNRKARQYVQDVAFGRLGDSKAIRKRMQNQLAEALMLGEGIPQIAARIRSVTQMSLRQARRVARTETIRTANMGRYLAAGQATEEYGIILDKKWIATNDERTRDSHAAMHGQVVGQHEIFTLPSGETAHFPLDDSLSASECVNCRCMIIFVVRSSRQSENYQNLVAKNEDITYTRLYQEAQKDNEKLNLDIKPKVTDQKLQNIVNDIYKGQSAKTVVGNGTTMDALRNELRTGKPTGKKFHWHKAVLMERGLNNRLNSRSLNFHDTKVAKELIEDIQNALAGN